MLFGMRPIIEAMQAGKTVEKIFMQRNLKSEQASEMSRLAKELEVPVAIVPIEKLNNLTRKNHQGAVAFVSPISYAPLEEIVASVYEKGEVPLFVVLDRVTDVRNFGSIARNAECLGAHALIIPSRGGAQINADAVKTSAGALNIIPVCREANLKNTINFLQDSGIQLVACTEKTDTDLTTASVDFTGPTALLLGSEEDGISPEYLKRCDAKVKIPILGQIESLNVAVATGIVLYEVVRQRQQAQ